MLKLEAMKLAASIAIALLAAPAVQAQPEAQATAAPPPLASEAKPSGNTVSGVTVAPPKAPKACSSRDKDCIAMVVAELKARYPKELQDYCDKVDWRIAATNMNADDLFQKRFGGSNAGLFYKAPVLKIACAKDPKPDPKK